MSLMGLISISGIFGKSNDLELLPPPPPFPDIGIDKPKDAAEDEWKLSRHKKEEEKPKKVDVKKEKIKTTERIKGIDRVMAEPPQPEQKKSFFGKLFGKKDEELEKELEELEEIKPMREKIEPIKDISDIKLPEMEIGESVKPVDLEKAQEEIRKSIESIQREKREPSIGRLFRKKEKEKVMEKIEMPEVMPRTFDKIDHVQEIEERIHKARMCLMDFKFDDAKRAYIEIMKLYNSLSQKDMYKVYQDISDLYYERKSAEKFSKI